MICFLLSRFGRQQGCLDLGCVPEGVAWQIDVTPVDFAARAIVHVAVDQPSKGLGHVSFFFFTYFFLFRV